MSLKPTLKPKKIFQLFSVNQQPQVQTIFKPKSQNDVKILHENVDSEQSSSEDEDTLHQSDQTRQNGRNQPNSVNVLSKDMASIQEQRRSSAGSGFLKNASKFQIVFKIVQIKVNSKTRPQYVQILISKDNQFQSKQSGLFQLKKSGSIFDDEQSWYNADLSTKIGQQTQQKDQEQNQQQSDATCIEIISLLHLQKFSTLKFKSKVYSIHILIDGITVESLPIDLSSLVGEAGSFAKVTQSKQFDLKLNQEDDISDVILSLEIDSQQLKSENMDDFLEENRSKTLDEHIIYQNMMYMNHDSLSSPLKFPHQQEQSVRKTSADTILPILKNIMNSPDQFISPEPQREKTQEEIIKELQQQVMSLQQENLVLKRKLSQKEKLQEEVNAEFDYYSYIY